MATYTCGPAGTYASIQTCVAAAVLVNGDTIQLMSGYSVDERVIVTGLSNITVIGDINNPNNYDVYYSNPLTTINHQTLSMDNCTHWTFKGFKIRYTGGYASSTAAATGGYNANGNHLFEDLIVETSGARGIELMGSDTTYRRCKFDGSSNAYSLGTEDAYLLGPDSAGANNTLVESCIAINGSQYGMYLGSVTSTTGPTLKNVTQYNNRAAGNASLIGITLLGPDIKVYNTVSAVDGANPPYTNDKALSINPGPGAIVSNCVLYGSRWGDSSDLTWVGGAGTETNVVKSSGVASSAVVFKNAAALDLTPVDGGLLVKTGDTTYAPPGGDINKGIWGIPPAIGAIKALFLPSSGCLGWGLGSFGVSPWGGADAEAPVILSVDPPCGAVQVHPCTPITLTVGDLGCSGFSLDCARITIDGTLIYDGTGLSFAAGNQDVGFRAPCATGSSVTRTPDPTYTYIYKFLIKCTCFTCDKKITMVATFCDNAGNTTTLDCYFTTAPCNFIDDIEIIDSKRYLLRFKNPLKGSIAENPDLYNPATYTVAPVDLGITSGKEVAVQAVLVEKVNFPQYVIVELTEPTEGAAYQFSASRLITDIYGNLLQEKGRGVAICRNTKLDFILNKLPTVYNRSIVVNGETEISPFYILSPMGIEDERSGGDF